LERASLTAVQTPQAFFYAPLLAAHRKAHVDGHAYTDDSEIWGAYVGPVSCVPGALDNRKITVPADISGGSGQGLRIGLGQDRHRLVAGRDLRLGGVTIPSAKGEDAHSDGDVLIHAFIDALLGAAAAGDIGERYPDTDARLSGADSSLLLREVWDGLHGEGWRLVNADCVVLLERPKVLPHRDAIRTSLASLLAVAIDKISVKAKTGEGIGDVGEGRIIEAWVSVLLGTQA
jgi:2-C-methyl-D-erythritol 4-phosphate cytidylyltransferase/2-C-methyl-D-erythritol 2,4-cyclodiphosphate synthase